MTRHEQIIEAARRKLKADTITIYMAEENTYKVSFINQTPDCRIRDPISVTHQEVEAVALEPKQEHDHNDGFCVKCAAMVSEAYQRGVDSNGKCVKISAESVYDFLQERFRPFLKGVNFRMLAQAIVDNFVAPERRPITFENLLEAFGSYDEMKTGYHSLGEIAERLNAVLNLQPAPVEAERCELCDHSDGASANVWCKHEYCECGDPFHRERGTV